MASIAASPCQLMFVLPCRCLLLVEMVFLLPRPCDTSAERQQNLLGLRHPNDRAGRVGLCAWGFPRPAAARSSSNEPKEFARSIVPGRSTLTHDRDGDGAPARFDVALEMKNLLPCA